MEFTGVVTNVIDKSGNKRDGSGSFIAWALRIEEPDGQYPMSFLADFWGEKVARPNVGDSVTVKFSTECTEYEGKFYGKNKAYYCKVNGEQKPDENKPVDPLANYDANGNEKPAPVDKRKDGFEHSDGKSDKDDLPF